MNQLKVLNKKKGIVRLQCTEQTYMLIEKLLDEYQKKMQEMSKKAAYKNSIPVMLNKFTKWLDTLDVEEYKDIYEIVSKVDEQRGNRQKMAIKDLIDLCDDVSINNYWLEFLQNGHARESIQKMKKSANKELYFEHLDLLLMEIQHSKIRDAEEFQSIEIIQFESAIKNQSQRSSQSKFS
ncbi:hypothetical protein pb186bvf_019812 [Paramecium bursaria]